MVLANENNGNALCEVADVRILYRPTDAEKQQALAELGDVPCHVSTEEFFGTSYTFPALDLYAAAHTIKDKPVVVCYSDDKYYTLILLRPCSAC